METPYLLICVTGGLIVNENNSRLLFGLTVLKDAASIADR